MVGRQLAHYEILEKIGAGGMGEVYRARDTKLDRDVALKVLPAEMAANADRLARFRREAKVVAGLSHPNIVTLHSVEEADGVTFLTMELVEGRSLREAIPQNGMSVRELFRVAIPLADAVQAAHTNGITHRDLKPDNVMLTGDGRVKVLDFGLAKLTAPISAEGMDTTGAETVAEGATVAADATMAADASVTGEGRILGTVAYMSPEQAEGKIVDHRSDIFSLGVLLYQMATGKRPFQGETSMSTISSILRDDPRPVTELNADIPNHLSRIVQRCLAKEPDRRYQAALDVRNELDALKIELGSQSASASAPAPSGPSKNTKSSNSALRSAAITALVAIGGLWLMRQFDDPPAPESAGDMPSALTEETKSIVVFPFENLGPSDQAYFAAGITDEITARLTKVSELRVLSRTSARQYERTGKSLRTIGEELDVDYVLDGTVLWDQRADGTSRVRVTPQLVHAADDAQLWSDSYDRDMEEIFAVQSDIAQNVVTRLNVELTPGEKAKLADAGTDNIEAWHAYQRGWSTLQVTEDDRDAWETALKAFEAAVDFDPSFALAHLEISRIHSAFWHYMWEPTEERDRQAREAADRALALAPDEPWGHLALGYYHYWVHKDYAKALTEFGRASSMLGADPEIELALANVKRRQGKFHEALGHYRAAMEMAPREMRAIFSVAETEALVGEHAAARASSDRVIEMLPEQAWPYEFAAAWAVASGDADRARAYLAATPSAARTSDESRSFLVSLWYAVGEYEKALALAETFSDELNFQQFFVVSREFARGIALRQLGREEEAVEALEDARRSLEAVDQERPDDARVQSALGLVLAYLGQKEAAITAARRGVDLFPRSIDAYIAITREQDLIRVLALVGELDEAVAMLEARAEENIESGALELRLFPELKALHEHPGYQALLRRIS